MCPACKGKVSITEAVEAVRCYAHHQPQSMELLPDYVEALLPMDPAAQLAPLKVEHLKSAGILLPETQHALEWLYRHRDTNGMAKAFRKVGGRRCIDLVAFAKLIRESK